MEYSRTALQWIFGVALIPLLFPTSSTPSPSVIADHPSTPEALVRAMFEANATRNMGNLGRLVSKDMVGYSIGGRKYVGWDELKPEMQQEFEAVTRLEIPVKDLRVWERGDLAWYTAEIDYIRYVGTGQDERKMILPLRESGVLERQQGRWLLVQWHESLERAPEILPVRAHADGALGVPSQRSASIDLKGEWQVQEEDKTYRAVLDTTGNGRYTWQDGVLVTLRLERGRWEGTWHQRGNDREGGFELRLSDDHRSATGRWWYTRVGTRSNIPPRRWGGEYRWERVNSGVLMSASP
jgi:ketosteroid isomerase-like protein